MKWIKKLFILSVFLPIFLINGANASTRITNFRRTYVSTINFKTYLPNNTYSNQTIENYVFSPIYRGFIIEAGDTFRASSLELNLSSSVDVTTSDYWELSIYVIVGVDGQVYIPTVLCPSFTSSGVMIDSCETAFHDSISDIDQIGSTSGTSTFAYNFYDTNYTFVELKLKGHFTWGATINQLKLSGPFLAIKNTTSSDYLSPKFMIGFNALRIYEEEEVEDKAATELEEMNDKDEQDRNDIESQSDSTEGEAESAGNAAESTGTSLFSAFTQLLTALTSVNGNTCTLPRMRVYTLDFGRINLCQFDIPPQIMALASIGMVFIIVPLGIHLVKRMINLYKEITG